MSACPLVTISWLSDRLGRTDLHIVDATWHLPAANRHAENEFREMHIPGAVFFDIDDYSAVSDLPHMMPSEADFSRIAGALGIGNHSTIIVYDSYGLFSAARVWWMFKVFGASSVYVLDGGLPAWIAAGHRVERGPGSCEPTRFKARLSPSVIATAEQVLTAANRGAAQIYDARSVDRFTAFEKEVRPGLRSGHIPGSLSLPLTDLLEGGYLKSREQLQSVFTARGFDPSKPVITTCGSGVTAAAICLALECIGYPNAQIYDGSWTEWGGRDDLPVVTGL